jgi:NAD(P)-dependent dehydrogenase (short-subunit alcohol dehydrogenase family)
MAEPWELGPVLITGGTGLVGIAIAFLEAGATTIVVGSSMHRSEAGREKLSGRRAPVHVLTVDFSNPNVVKGTFATVEREFCTVAVLVNGAGLNFYRQIGEITPADFDRVMGVNVKAALFRTRTACERMISRGIRGRVIDISSGNFRYVRPGSAIYSASKAALEILTRSFALEYGRHGIAVNAVAPGLVERSDSNDETYLRGADYYRAHSSQQRLVTAANAAVVVLLLASTHTFAIGGEL